jgi:hypothetical protein
MDTPCFTALTETVLEKADANKNSDFQTLIIVQLAKTVRLLWNPKLHSRVRKNSTSPLPENGTYPEPSYSSRQLQKLFL